MKIDDLKEAEYNPRKITPEAIDGLKASIRTLGNISGICFNKRTGRVFAGHQRIRALKEEYGDDLFMEGTEDAPVIVCPERQAAGHRPATPEFRFDVRVVDWPEDLERIANITANNPHIQGDWTDDALSLLKQTEIDFPDLGKSLRLTDLEGDLTSIAGKGRSKKKDAQPRLDEAESLQKQWGTATGQIWKLGSHKVICGNCTDKAVLSKVMGNEKAHLLFTSPPYWVGMEYETQKSEKEIDEFIGKCTATWSDFVGKNFGRIVINTGTAAIHRIEKKRKVEVLPLVDKWQRELKKTGWQLRHLRIWAKRGDLPARVSPRLDVVDQHWEQFATFDNDEWEYVGTFWNPEGDQRGMQRIMTDGASKWVQQGIWDDIHGDRGAGGKHCAAFPVEIPERHISLYTQVGEIVLEPFLGSGTTIIASENLDRRCIAVEVSPNYVAVALQRYKDAMGVTPERQE